MKIGLALGGGAVKGLAHIGLLKLLDKHQIKVDHISGTSMGAIVGALYATGMSAEEIEARVKEHIVGPGEKLKAIFQKRGKLLRWAKIFGYEKNSGGLVTADGLFKHLFEELNDLEFNQLKIPFSCAATDFYTGKEVILNNHLVLSAVRASMAVPGIFAPVTCSLEGKEHCLIDGGLVNNLPTNQIQQCDFKIASDVIALSPKTKPKTRPKTLTVVNGAINIMLQHATALALERYPADFIHHCASEGVEAFDFHKIGEVLQRGDEAALANEARLLKAIEDKQKVKTS